MGNGEFTLNVTLIFKEDPVLGVVMAPAFDKLYVGCCNTSMAFDCKEIADDLTIGFDRKAMKRVNGPTLKSVVLIKRSPKDLFGWHLADHILRHNLGAG